MDATSSVSKGCFVFKSSNRRKSSEGSSSKRKYVAGGAYALRQQMTAQPCYKVYAETWKQLERHIAQLQAQSYGTTLDDVVAYVRNECSADGNIDTFGMEEVVPTAVLLTGVNQPDHLEQFTKLSECLSKNIPVSVCMLQSRDCPTLKSAVETMVYNFIEMADADQQENNVAENENAEESTVRERKRLRRSMCNMRRLLQWYRNNYTDARQDQCDALLEDPNALDNSEFETFDRSHALIIILPDFEGFNAKVLQDFILILSSYYTRLPFVLIFGVATSVDAIHNVLPFQVTTKIKFRLFKTQSAPVCLSEILERVILSPKYAFHLSGKVFKFLTHIFLYYDFSIQGFIKGYKYCLMEHFFQGNAYALCSSYTASLNHIKSLTHDDMEAIRRLLSFRPYVEAITDCKRIIAILTDDNYLKKKLPQLLRNCHIHFIVLRIFLEFLTEIVADLPKCPLGKQRRELYALCLAKELTEQTEFKECWQMLSFMSKEEFIAKITNAVKVTKDYMHEHIEAMELASDCMSIVNAQLETVKEMLNKVQNSSFDVRTQIATADTSFSSPKSSNKAAYTSRQDLKEHLLQLSKQQKSTNAYSQTASQLLTYIKTNIVASCLAPLARAPPLHELFVFSDVHTLRRNIIGAPRAALHMALNNPHFYMQCKCCQLQEPGQILPTLPDLSVAYKLHLECGRMINLFDWLQAFRSVVDYSEEQHEQVDPQIQARFTRAVAELQFLGYIKMSKRKTDHAMRLTW